MAINPTGPGLKEFLSHDDGQPVVMLNLLRFVEDGGRERYAEYVEHFNATASGYGARLIYQGVGGTPLVAEAGQDWDAVLLVEYPSRQAFSDMMRDENYQTGTHIRTEALIEAVLQPTTPMS